MPEPEREVFRRARFRDMDYLQIAADLNITVSEVERLMTSAIRHLVGWK